MKYILLALFALSSTFSYAQPEVISLGSNCGPAEMLRHYGLRKNAYPFDWISTDHCVICTLFEENFHKFIDAEYLMLADDRKSVVNTYYGIKYTHDFPRVNGWEIDPNWMDKWPEIKAKYQRRIQRLKDVLNGEEEVIFFREGHVLKWEAWELRSVIRDMYPDLKFTLVVISYFTNENYDWQLPGIVNIHSKFDIKTYKDRPEWKDLLIQLNLLKEDEGE